MGTVEALLEKTTPHPGGDAASYGTNRIYKFHSGSGTSYGGDGYGSGDVVLGTALDLDNGKIWWSFNGAWIANGNPAAGTYPAYTGLSGTFYPMVGIWDTASPATVNFGATAFTYTPPTGFSAYYTPPAPVLFAAECAVGTGADGGMSLARNFPATLTPATAVMAGNLRLYQTCRCEALTTAQASLRYLRSFFLISEAASETLGHVSVSRSFAAGPAPESMVSGVLGVTITRAGRWVSALGDGGVMASCESLERGRTVRAILALGLATAASPRAMLSLSGDSTFGAARWLGELAARDVAGGAVAVRNDLTTGAESTIRLPDYDILLDGASIRNALTQARVVFDEDQVHNEVFLDGVDTKLWRKADPSQAPGSSRLLVRVGSRSLPFLLEERSGTEEGFTIWGRSLSATEDEPHAVPSDYSIETFTPASELAARMAGTRGVDWLAVDWLIPPTFEFVGTGAAGLVRLAEEIGGVARADDDGRFIVRPCPAIRPVYLPKATPAFRFERAEDLLALSVSMKRGNGFNRVTVEGYSPDVELPKMEVEAETQRGEDAFVRVYWCASEPAVTPERYATDGQTMFLGAFEETVTELLDFADGQAQASKPVHELLGIDWIGDSSPGMSAEVGGDLIQLEGTDDALASRYRVGRVSYRTRFWRYRLWRHDVERLLMAIKVPTVPDTTVDVVIGDGDIAADAVKAPFLFGAEAAAARGLAELDNQRYDAIEIQFDTPRLDVVDGQVIAIDDGELGIAGNFLCRSAEIICDGPQVIGRYSAVQYQVTQ